MARFPTLAGAGALLLGSLFPACASTHSPRPELARGGAAERPDPAELDLVLERFVDDRGRVDYAGLVAAPDDLARFYARLAAVSPDSHPGLFPAEADRLAYWINAYNAAVLELVVASYPIASVKDVQGSSFLADLAGFFYQRWFFLGGERISLYALENDVVIDRFGEPRVHFALNCASVSCPRLPRRAFRAATLDADLDREARAFFAEERNLHLDHEARTVRLSQILEWYREDFTGWMRAQHPDRPATLLEYVALFAPDDVAAELRGRAVGYAIEFVPYGWALNDQALGSE